MNVFKFRVYDADLGCIMYLEDMIERALRHKDRMLNGEVIVDCDAGNILNLMRQPESLIKWMQYTGLKDKNGKEIYEGDIVKAKYNTGKELIQDVAYEESRFALHSGDNECQSWNPMPTKIMHIGKGVWCTEVEIIGNIYENTELINQSPSTTQ